MLKPIQNASIQTNGENDNNNSLLEIPVDNDTLSELQQKDTFCANIIV